MRFQLFNVAPEIYNYTLTIGGYGEYTFGWYGDYTGISLRELDGNPFSTYDRDNGGRNCPVDRQGAWWYHGCGRSNLNGRYNPGEVPQYGMYWYHWKSSYESLKATSMMVRPQNFDPTPGQI